MKVGDRLNLPDGGLHVALDASNSGGCGLRRAESGLLEAASCSRGAASSPFAVTVSRRVVGRGLRAWVWWRVRGGVTRRPTLPGGKIELNLASGRGLGGPIGVLRRVRRAARRVGNTVTVVDDWVRPRALIERGCGVRSASRSMGCQVPRAPGRQAGRIVGGLRRGGGR
jgi:hypothetical protein